MYRLSLFLVSLLLMGSPNWAQEEGTVKPASLKAEKKAETQLFVKTLPEGARILIDGEAVGSSPHLFVVPPGARTMTVVVELDGYENGQRTVEIHGGKITRVTFEMRKENTAPSPTGATGRKKAAPSAESGREAALRFGRALAGADRETLEEFWKLEDPLDREAANLILSALRRERIVRGKPPRIELVHCARIGKKHLSACYFADPGLLFGEKPAPIFQSFELENGSWRTLPLGNLRTLPLLKEEGAEKFGRQTQVRKMIDFRFGSSSWEERIAGMKALADSQRALSEPPYNLSMFQGAAGALLKKTREFEMLAGQPWSEIEKKINAGAGAGELGSPADFFLLFYLEAAPGQGSRSIPWAENPGSQEPFLAERIPCLTEGEVEKATVERDAHSGAPQVRVSLTRFGARVLDRITRENTGKKIAIVVEGRVVSAAVIRSVIAGGQAVITGRFTVAEVERIARALNSYREKCKKYLDFLRQENGLNEYAPTRTGSATRTPASSWYHVLRRSDVVGVDPITLAPANCGSNGKPYSEGEIVDLTLAKIIRENDLVTKLEVFERYGMKKPQVPESQLRNPGETLKDWPEKDQERYYRAAAIVIQAIKELNPQLNYEWLRKPGGKIFLPDPALF